MLNPLPNKKCVTLCQKEKNKKRFLYVSSSFQHLLVGVFRYIECVAMFIQLLRPASRRRAVLTVWLTGVCAGTVLLRRQMLKKTVRQDNEKKWQKDERKTATRTVWHGKITTKTIKNNKNKQQKNNKTFLNANVIYLKILYLKLLQLLLLLLLLKKIIMLYTKQMYYYYSHHQ